MTIEKGAFDTQIHIKQKQFWYILVLISYTGKHWHTRHNKQNDHVCQKLQNY
jgi:hypothetical protein